MLASFFACTVLLLGFGLTPAFGDLIPKPEASDVSGKIDWIFDYQRGQELSKSSGKPMFVVFRCER